MLKQYTLKNLIWEKRDISLDLTTLIKINIDISNKSNYFWHLSFISFNKALWFLGDLREFLVQKMSWQFYFISTYISIQFGECEQIELSWDLNI